MTIEITTSVAESIPSPTTAKLPDINPIIILEADNMAFPMVLIQEALINILFLEEAELFMIKWFIN
jgi:hypothetical protein